MISLPTNESDGSLNLKFNCESFSNVFYFFESTLLVLSKASWESSILSKLKLNKILPKSNY